VENHVTKSIQVVVAAVVVLSSGIILAAQQQGARGGGAPQAPQAPPTPQAAAPIDLAGYWVAVVTEDWRWRMVTPPKGDFASVPLNAEGTKVGNSWDPATDGSCLAYGAAGLLRNPTRVHITWENPQTLKVETDAGVQTRRFVFGQSQPPAQRSLQGYSVAEWEFAGGGGRGGGGGGGGGGRGGQGAAPAGPRNGNLKVTTTMMSAAWLRKNGVPYSENAMLTEYYDRFASPNGDEWFAVTTIVSDPKYLNQDFVTSTHFKKEADGSKWAPKPCKG
jgi:hypothetical protein